MTRTPTTGCRASARLAWPALRRVRALGKDVREALARVGLTDDELRDPDFRMAEELLDALWVACRDVARDEAFGIHAGLGDEQGLMGVVEYVMRNSATLGDAMLAGMRFQRVLHDAGDDQLSVDGDRAMLRVRLSSGREPAGVLVDYGFARALGGAMLLTGTPGRPLEVRFVHSRPKRIGPWERTFQCPLYFDEPENVLVFRRDRLEAPILASDPGLLAILEQHAQSQLAKIPDGGGFVRRVCELIAEELTGGTPTAERIATKLHMSGRTLARRLTEEGTSFSTLLDDLRRELAVSHLRDRDISVSEVAFLLGFADANAFSRAFKRWTGEPPSHFKRAC